ncbi:hypothetical protein MMC07_002892 [Pseudocyphellaria aurata]|nr:hypothetical protein [Pseudocyphellaria aurata]
MTASNLSDEHAECYSKGSQENSGASRWRVKSLWIYPVKSCRGVELSEGTVISTGMQYDRQFSFARLQGGFPASSTETDAEAKIEWKFITQRERPQLAQVKTEIWIPDPLSPDYSPDHPNVQSEGVLIFKFPIEDGLWGWMSNQFVRMGGRAFERSFQVPYNPTQKQIKDAGYETEKMIIWKDSPLSLLIASTSPSQNNPVMKELSRFLNISSSLGLFRVSDERELYRCAPRKEQLGYQSRVGFQDAYPLHLLNLASVRDVGKRLIKGSPTLSALQFRCNILITGPEAYAEDDWKSIKIGESEYYVCCRTARCILPNVNQITGVRDKTEPYQTLRSYRAIDPGAGKNACLGMQMVPAEEECTIKVGDFIEVLETGEHYYLKQ